MRTDRTALVCAFVAFIVTSLLALAASDFPPPGGFLWLEVLLAVLAGLVYRRVFSRLTARAQGRRVPVAGLEGLAVAMLVGLTLLAFSPGEPGVTPTVGDRLMWLLALGLVGVAFAQLLWGLAVLAVKLNHGDE